MPTAPSIPASDRLAGWLRRLDEGATLLLGADPLQERMTVGSLAAGALERKLDEARMAGRARTRRGVPEVGDSAGTLLLQQGAIHEAAWMAAGALFADLAAAEPGEPSWSTVVYLDPWAATLDDLVRRHWPRASLCLIDDIDARRSTGDPDYWDEWRAWLQDRALDELVPAPTLLDAIGDDLWTSASARDGLAAAHGATDETLPGQHIIIDEASTAPPRPDIVLAIADRWRDRQIVLLTPHLTAYQDQDSALLERCSMVVSTEDLSPATYAGILSEAGVYIAPHGAPFGSVPLGLIPERAALHLPHGHRIPARLHASLREHRHADDLLDHLRQPTSAGIASGRSHAPPPTRSTERPMTSAGGSADLQVEHWWKRLTPLLAETTSAPRPVDAEPIRAKPPSALVDLSILTCCYKYLQRFRVFIDSVVRQDHPLDRIEVCVAAPGNPDGLMEYLHLVRQVHPALRLTTVDLPEAAHGNKGKMLNAAFARSMAPRIMVADCDLVLPRSFVSTLVAEHRPDRVLGCWRTPMGRHTTARILTGDLDPVASFDELATQWDEAEIKDGVRQGLLGYCQVVARSAMEQVRYPEEFEGFNQSDIVFIDRLREQLGIVGDFRKDLFVLHLSHHRDWSGTKVFL